MRAGKAFFYIMICALLVILAFIAYSYYYRTLTIHELLTENKHLREAITNLTNEDQIGYAKVIAQETKNGKLLTTIKFVETARDKDDELKKILEKEYTIEGDVVHFDALIVKFGDKLVMDGRERSLYLWRRVYDEKTAPENGFPIEQSGVEPKRYDKLLSKLPITQRNVFWSDIWSLANNPEALKQYGIKALYGNATYSKLTRGLIYVFKITPVGQVYPEVIPEM